MTCIHSTFTLSTTADIDILDITQDVQSVVKVSGIENGQVCVFIGGSTGSITTIEYEPGVVKDLKRTLKEIAPPDREYEHDAAWGDGNGYSHVLSALLGPTQTFPIDNGTIQLGTWQQIVLVDLDNKPRRRLVRITCMGE